MIKSTLLAITATLITTSPLYAITILNIDTKHNFYINNNQGCTGAVPPESMKIVRPGRATTLNTPLCIISRDTPDLTQADCLLSFYDLTSLKNDKSYNLYNDGGGCNIIIKEASNLSTRRQSPRRR